MLKNLIDSENTENSEFYKPSSQEITNFKKNNIVSSKFKNIALEFIKELDKEILEFDKIKDNEVKFSEEIKFYSQSDDYFELSPFYVSSFNFGGISFNSVEQMYDFIKSLYSSNFSVNNSNLEILHEDSLNMAFKILIQTKPIYCYNYAKKVETSNNFKKSKIKLLYICNKFKFMNNQNLINKLKETEGKTLIWDNKFSSDLGVGRNGKGKNIFGIILMTLRNNI